MTEPNIDTLLAPGCFGAALAYKEGSTECASCPFQPQCAPEATARLAAMRAAIGIDKLKKTPYRPTPPKRKPKEAPAETATPAVAVEPIPPGLPIKVAALALRIRNKGIDVAASLKSGLNPFADTPAFMRLACDLLLKGGYDRQVLRAALIQGFDWSYGTANAHVAQVFSILVALGAAEERAGMLRLRAQ